MNLSHAHSASSEVFKHELGDGPERNTRQSE